MRLNVGAAQYTLISMMNTITRLASATGEAHPSIISNIILLCDM